MRKPSRQGAGKKGRGGQQGRRRSQDRVAKSHVVDGPVVELQLEKLAWGGDAIARLEDGRIVFVDGGFPTETVQAKITQDGKSFCRASLVEVVATEVPKGPVCPTADRCGGCRFQGVDYEEELRWKAASLRDMLYRLCREPRWPDEIEVVPSAQPQHYRERVRLRVDDEGQTGYHGRNSHEFVPAVRCDVLHPALELARAYAGRLTGGLLRVHTIRLEWDATRHRVVVEVPCDNDSWDPVREALLERLQGEAPPALEWNEKPIEWSVTLRHQGRWEAMYGEGTVQRWFGGALVEQRSGNFSQANAKLNERMRERVADLVKDGWDARAGAQRVADFFSGAGNLSYAIAARHARVVAIDHASEAIDAGEAAHLEPAVRGVASWVASDLARGPFDALREHLEYSDALVLDPPRGGVCAELLADIAQTSARKIVYVSCDPPALARDISRLYSAGWRVKHVEAWDMFPRTAHLEVIVELYRSW